MCPAHCEILMENTCSLSSSTQKSFPLVGQFSICRKHTVNYNKTKLYLRLRSIDLGWHFHTRVSQCWEIRSKIMTLHV